MSDFDEDPQTAMLLTETEWADLAKMLRFYEEETRWVCYSLITNRPGIADIVRKRDLAQRIIEAAS